MSLDLERVYKPKYVEKCTVLYNKIKKDDNLYKKLKKDNIYMLTDVYSMAREGLNGFTNETNNVTVQLRVQTFTDAFGELTSDNYQKRYMNNGADCFVHFEKGIINPASYDTISRMAF